jgi:hypothetical protein
VLFLHDACNRPNVYPLPSNHSRWLSVVSRPFSGTMGSSMKSFKFTTRREAMSTQNATFPRLLVSLISLTQALDDNSPLFDVRTDHHYFSKLLSSSLYFFQHLHVITTLTLTFFVALGSLAANFSWWSFCNACVQFFHSFDVTTVF